MSEQDKLTIIEIENHIKGLLFNNSGSATSPSVQNNSDLNYNMSPYLFGNEPFVSNSADTQHKDKLVPPLPIDCGFNKQPISSSSQLIDVNVLTDFAAKHADINDISNSSRVLPHPEYENDSVTSHSTSISKNTLLSNSPSENKSPSKFPRYSKILPENNLANIERNSDRFEHPNNAERPSSDKKRKPRKRKTQFKEKADHKLVEKSVLTPSPRKESPKQEIVNVNHQGALQEAPEMKNDTGSNSDVDLKHFAPILAREKEYTIFFEEDGSSALKCHLCNYDAKSKEYGQKHLLSENHRVLKQQIKSDRVLPFLPKPLPGQIEAINKLLMKCYTEYGLQDGDLLLRGKLANRLIEFVKQHLSGCSVDMIGSSVTGLGLKSSKVDFVLKVAQEQSIPDSLELLYKKLLSDSAYCDVVSEFKEKRLGILFSDKETGLNCSIILENAFSEKFAKLFAMYSELDPRVKILASCFKYWAQICYLDNQDRGTLPPYTFSILLVYFLQQIEPAVLPVLHEVKEYGNANFVEKYIEAKAWKSKNDCSLGELWIKLFYFYNFDYELGKHVVCIRSSEKVLCSEKNWSTKFYAIEDPFSRRNIAHVIPNFQVFQYIHQCFKKTYRYFAFPQTNKGTINLLKMEEYESLLLSYVPPISETKEYSDEESCPSDNEDSSIPEESSILQDFEDHDPEIPIENVLETFKHISIDGNKSVPEGEMMADSPVQTASLQQSSVKPESPKKEARIKKEKLMKAEERQKIQSACSWDLQNQQITKEMFKYKMDPSLFKNKKDVPFRCKLCKSTGHLKKNCPNDDLPVRIELPEMTPEFLRLVNRTLFHILNKNCVDDADKDFMMRHMKDIESEIQKLFPDACLSMFGSFCNGFGFKSRSDMDFCLTFKDLESSKDLDSTGVIESLAKQLRRFPKLENIVPVTSAKVPIVKFTCTESGLEGDISLYNTLAIANTEMLEMYSKIDHRVQVLGFALKYFAKVLGICDASRGSLSSYAYILMVIFFLQQRQPPVIPVLQELHGDEKPVVMVDEWNVWYYKDLEKLPEVWPDFGKNTETVAELWFQLLSFYSYDFDWREYVVSIKQKALLTRFRKLWITDQIAIEDPFDLSHNLGAGLSRKMNMYILRTFVRGRERFGRPLFSEDYVRIQNHEISYLFDHHFLSSGSNPPHDRGCRICGKIGHIAKNCSQERLCCYCRKPGHFVKSCPHKKAKAKAKHMDKSMKETFPNFNNRNKILDMENISSIHVPAQMRDIHRTNIAGFNMKKNIDDRDSTRKLLQMGFPSHRHPPPGFPTNFSNPPPGFKAMQQNSANFSRFPSPCPAPFPRPVSMTSNLSRSPPKHYSISPPKNFINSNMYHPESSVPTMGLRPELNMTSDPMLNRIWQNHLPNYRMSQQYTDHRKWTH